MVEQKNMGTQPALFPSKSCRGVSFETKLHIGKFQYTNASTLKVFPEEIMKDGDPQQKDDGGGAAAGLPRLAKARTALSRRFSRKISSLSATYRSLQRRRRATYSSDFSFGQLPADDDDDDDDKDDDAGIPPAAETAQYDPSSGPASAISRERPVSQAKSRIHTILLEQSWFSVYKRLFALSFITNLVFLIVAADGRFKYAKTNAALFSVANILMVVLVRNEVFLFCVYYLTVKVFGHSWIPLMLKNAITALLQNLGGIHSACGVSSVLWLIYAIEEMIRHRRAVSNEILGVAIAIMALLVCSCLGAFPLLRHLHHNVFERVHRFSGWSSLALVWIFVILSSSYDPDTRSYSVRGSNLVKKQALWYTSITTFMIILPWLTVRKIRVETTIPEARNNSLLSFSGGMKPGILARISLSPLSEWHAFGIISDGKNGHTILAGAVGDFTKGLVQHPPQQIWVRSFHFAGYPYLTNMYERVVQVATGSGICVFMSFLLQPTRANVHLIWIAKNIQKSYGDEIFRMVDEIPPYNLTVIDTAISGRPKTIEIVMNKAREWEAQVVIVTSNPAGTKEIVGSCRMAGIPAFGPIWDS